MVDKKPKKEDGRHHPDRIFYRNSSEYVAWFIVVMFGLVLFLCTLGYFEPAHTTQASRDFTEYKSICEPQGGFLLQINDKYLCINRKVIVFLQ